MFLTLAQEKKLLKVVASLEKDVDRLIHTSYRNDGNTLAFSVLAKIEYIKLYRGKAESLSSFLS